MAKQVRNKVPKKNEIKEDINIEMIKDAMNHLKQGHGSTVAAILKCVCSKYSIKNKDKAKQKLNVALKTGVKNGSFIQSNGKGVSALFKLSKRVVSKHTTKRNRKEATEKVVDSTCKASTSDGNGKDFERKSPKQAQLRTREKKNMAILEKGKSAVKHTERGKTKATQERNTISAANKRADVSLNATPHDIFRKIEYLPTCQKITPEQAPAHPREDNHVVASMGTTVGIASFEESDNSIKGSSKFPFITTRKRVPFRVRVPGDQECCVVRGLACTPDGRIIVADSRNKNVKMFDQNEVFLSSHAFPHLWKDGIHVAVANNEGVVVYISGRFGNKINIFDIKDNKWVIKETINHNGIVLSVSACGDKLVVAERLRNCTTLRLLERNGIVLHWGRTTPTLTYNIEEPLYSTCFLERNKPVVIVNDSRRKTLLKLDGETSKILNIHSEDGAPFGASCVDVNTGVLYVCNKAEREVSVFSSDFKTRSLLLNPSVGLGVNPKYITFNPVNNQLLIVTEDNDEGYDHIQVFHISYD